MWGSMSKRMGDGWESVKGGGQFSVLSSQFSVLGSQFSVLSSRFSVLGSRFSVLGSLFSVLGRGWLIDGGSRLFFLHKLRLTSMARWGIMGASIAVLPSRKGTETDWRNACPNLSAGFGRKSKGKI